MQVIELIDCSDYEYGNICTMLFDEQPSSEINMTKTRHHKNRRQETLQMEDSDTTMHT